MTVEEVLRQAEAVRAACTSDPGLWNLLRAEQDWALCGDACDPLSAEAPERALKALQKDIYLEVWDRVLAEVAAGARVLLAGGGTGRFARELLDRGFGVDLVDASPEAIRRAQEHFRDSLKARVGDLSQQETLPEGAYDLVLAVEVACYATRPGAVMDALVRSLRSSGTLLFSVEARPGALLSDPDLASPEAARAVLDSGMITLPGVKHVHYYSRAEAMRLAEDAGLRTMESEGVCYVPDGPLNALVDATRLENTAHLEDLREAERRCRRHPVLREMPRAWAVSAVKR